MRNALLLPLLVFALTSCAAVTQQEWHTLAQGDVGVIVTYGVNGSEPRFDSVQTGVAVAINPWKQAWVEYPGGQQTLTMVRAEKEGKVQGDDSVQCHDKNGVQVNWDVSVVWRVDPAHVGELYVLQPKRPLSGAPGNDIEDLIVRRIARNVVPIACGLQTYIEMYTGPGKQKLQQDATRLMQDDAAKEFIKVDGVFPGEMYLQAAQQQAISALADAQTAVSKSGFAKQQAENEAAAAIAKANGEAQQKQIQAEADAKAKVTQAQADAQVTRLQAEAQAEANRTLSSSLDDRLLQYREIEKWNGQVPQVQAGNGQQPQLQLPVPVGH